MTENKQITIDIFGSCICRDALSFDKSNTLSVKTFISYISPIIPYSQSMFKKITMEDILSLNSQQPNGNWLYKQVYYNLSKKIFEEFKSNPSEYFIFDIALIRNDLIRLKNNPDCIYNESTILYNNLNFILNKEFESTEGLEFEKFQVYELSINYITKALDFLVDKILKIYDKKKIIFISSTTSKKYYSKENTIEIFKDNDYNHKITSVTELCNAYIKQKYQDVFTIIECPRFLGLENHKWGLGRLHYIDEAYQNILDKIFLVINNEYSIEKCRELDEIYKSNEKTYYKKTNKE